VTRQRRATILAYSDRALPCCSRWVQSGASHQHPSEDYLVDGIGDSPIGDLSLARKTKPRTFQQIHGRRSPPARLTVPLSRDADDVTLIGCSAHIGRAAACAGTVPAFSDIRTD
jgi:hypothetical protein